jgi:hypothetical protein
MLWVIVFTFWLADGTAVSYDVGQWDTRAECEEAVALIYQQGWKSEPKEREYHCESRPLVVVIGG